MSPLDRRGAVNADVLSPDGLPSKGVSLGDNIQEAGSTDYARLLDQYGGMGDLVEGEVVKGKVLKVTSSEVIVDVGYKSEGMISIEEFIGLNGSINVKPGDEIDVLLEFAEDHEGHVVLSREKAERIKAWDGIEKAFSDAAGVNVSQRPIVGGSEKCKWCYQRAGAHPRNDRKFRTRPRRGPSIQHTRTVCAVGAAP